MRTLNRDNAGAGGKRLVRGASRVGGKLFGLGNIEATRSELNSEQEKLISAQYGNGDDSNIRAFWAKKEVDENGKETGRWVGIDGKATRFTQVDVDKARQIVGRDPSRVQAYAKYEMGKVANDEQLGEFKKRFIDMANDPKFNWTPGDANGVWAGVKFAHQGTRLEQKHTSIDTNSQRGHLTWGSSLPEEIPDRFGNMHAVQFGDVNHESYSEELADRMRSYDRVSLRPSAAKAALEGYRYNKQLITSGSLSGDALTKAQSIVDNYTLAAQDVRTSLRQGVSFQNDDADNAPVKLAGGSTGGSPRADVVWKEFADEVLGSTPPTGGSSNNRPSSGGPSPVGPTRPSPPSGGSGTPAPSRPSGPSPSGSGSASGPRQASRQQSSPDSWGQVIPHAPTSTPTVPPVTPSSDPGSRRATREQGPSTPPTFGGSASVGQTSGPQGAVSPTGSRRAVRPQGAPTSTDPSPTPLPPTTIITPTNPSSIDLPPHNNPINPPQQTPGTGPADLPDWMRNGGDNNPPSTT